MERRQGRKRAEKTLKRLLNDCAPWKLHLVSRPHSCCFFSSLAAGLFFWPAVITPTPFTSSFVYFCECSLFYTLAFLQTRVVGHWRFSLSRWGHLLEMSTMTPQQPVKSLWALRHSSFGPFRAIWGRFFFFFFQSLRKNNILLSLWTLAPDVTAYVFSSFTHIHWAKSVYFINKYESL